jgi:hypothetical protein
MYVLRLLPLTSLELRSVNMQHVQQIVLSSLQSVGLTGVAALGLSVLSSAHSLQWLELSCKDPVLQWDQLQQLPELRQLRVEGYCLEDWYESIQQLGGRSWVSGLTSLGVSCHVDVEWVMQDVVSRTTRLRELELGMEMMPFSGTALLLLSGFSQLTSLTLGADPLDEQAATTALTVLVQLPRWSA